MSDVVTGTPSSIRRGAKGKAAAEKERDGLDPRDFLRVRTDRGLRVVISGCVRPLNKKSNASGT